MGNQLLNFGEAVFPEIESGNILLRSWFHEIIAQELMRWDSEPDYPYLLIEVPPRHGKSEIVSRFLPPYLFGKNPNTRIIATSYGQDLANDMSRDVQHIMLCDAYKSIFPDVKLSTTGIRDGISKRQVSSFDIIGGSGYYIGRGVGGAITGRGADRIIIDDPVKNRADAESPVYREACWRWYISTLRTRLQKDGKIVMLLTRWHEDDLAGRVLQAMKDDDKADKWRVISFPALACDSEYRHEKDTRQYGEALWPEMYTLEYLLRTKATQGTYDWEALYQQEPIPAGGAVFKREWLSYVDKAPENLEWVRYWDIAVSAKAHANFTASLALAKDKDGMYYLANGIRGRWEWPTARRMIIGQYKNDPEDYIGVESVGTQKGLVDDLCNANELANAVIKGYSVDRDKLTRALPWFARAEAGKLKIVRGAWVNDFVDELLHFTGLEGGQDDQVDAASGAYSILNQYIEAGIIIPEDSIEMTEDQLEAELMDGDEAWTAA